jgi:fructose/tagatose bisphosphate aldolase
MKAINAILEIEIGVVGGEEDGVSHDINEHLYTTLDDAIATVEALGFGDQGRYIAALTFGNVHGVYKPGNVRLRPELLGEIQAGLAAKYGTAALPLDLVFHGGSGSSDEEIATAVANGVVKMNIDTDTQYAFSRSIADSVLRTASSRSTARSETRRSTTRAAGARLRNPPWPPASSKRPGSWVLPGTPRANQPLRASRQAIHLLTAARS